MSRHAFPLRVLWATFVTLLLHAAAFAQSDPLPSWNDGKSKQAILEFVAKVTTPGSPTYVDPAERIATFDNDGTLWSEQPMYSQVLFALDRVKANAAAHPEWANTPALKAAMDGDLKGLAAEGEQGMFQVIMATHAGMTADEFAKSVAAWLATAKHPRFKQPYTSLVFQPMGELLTYLRANGFKTFIVSGGEVSFMRVFTERIYGIPPEQVVGTVFGSKFEMRDGMPVIMREPKIAFIDDKDGKPVGIYRFIGRRPIFAFGNSDGDLQMLQWTAAGAGARFMGIVHHTDAEREWAYDRDSKIGTLDKALDEAEAKGWTIVDMKKEWNRVYPFEQR